MKSICMIGEGAWGTAVSTLLAANGYEVRLWCHDADVLQSINKKRVNERYLPGIKLDQKIKPTISLQEALDSVTWVFEAIPVKYLRFVCEQAKDFYRSEQIWVCLSKGIENETLMFPTQILHDVLDSSIKTVVLAGPSFAKEVAEKKMTAVTVAATEINKAIDLQKMLANYYFRPYTTTDVIGVQVGAALKNVITLGIGMIDGLEMGENTKGFLLTRGLHEMVSLATTLGAKQQTLYGLSGVGDLVITAMSALSRNLAVGRLLGQGKQLETILKETGYIPEGVNTLKSMYQMIEQQKLDLPICQGIYEVIYKNKSLSQILDCLMSRVLEKECS